MKDHLNIEELFRETLGNIEVTPNDAVWKAIQTKMAAKATAATATTAKTVISVYKALSIVAIGAVVATSAYFIFNKNESKPTINTPKPHTQKEIKIQQQHVPEPSNEADEIIIVNTNKNTGNKNAEKIKVTIKQQDAKINPGESSVQTWLTPAYIKEKLMAQQNNRKDENKIVQTNNSLNDEVNHNQAANKNNGQNNTTTHPIILTENISQEKVAASIITNVSGGPAPLVVNFSNIEDAASYLWIFEDGKTSTEANPTHIFEKAGTYTVTLQVKDKNGNSSMAKTKIEVKSSSAIEIVNVFSPNGDGVNDYFEARTKENIDIFSIQVITTDAKKTVFSSTDVNFMWDGRDASGNPCPSGNYIFIGKAIGKDGKEYKLNGMLTLIR